MKKILSFFLHSLLLAGLFLVAPSQSRASHIVGAELRYRCISGLTYEVTVYLYGDCGPSSSGSFASLITSAPQVCIYDGSALNSNIALAVVPRPTSDSEVTPVCPDFRSRTQCTNTSFTVPGIKKFVYRRTVTLPYRSSVWRFVYNGYNGGGSALSGRAAAITNIAGAGGTIIQLIDTLNNLINTSGVNSSPVLTVEPTPFFCGLTGSCYNPGAVDLNDVTSYRSGGDSLVFQLISATNGTGTPACSVGGPVGYTGLTCTGTPATGSRPLHVVDCTPASFSFDPSTGQLCFVPYNQRSVVVYNIREFRGDTLVGTIQREMTFLVQTCTYTTPTAIIDSNDGAGVITDSTKFTACGNTGNFTLYMNPREPGDTTDIACTATGLPPGAVFTVTGDNTPTPRCELTWTTDLTVISPGIYNFYVTFTDDHCPLVGIKTIAYTITIYPVPAVRDSIISPATCNRPSRFYIIPGGTGKPWRIKVSEDFTADTLHTFVDTLAILDSLPPGSYHITIFSDVTNECSVSIPLVIDTPRFATIVTSTDPTYCGVANGSMVLYGLEPRAIDTVWYVFNGTGGPLRGFTVTDDGTDTITGLLAGTYTNIIVKEGFCLSLPATTTLTNPPFTHSGVTSTNPSKCGVCDGVITIHGLYPGQLDTVDYFFAGGLVTFPYYTVGDSMLPIPRLCDGRYTSMIVHTAGVCTTAIAPVSLVQPPITADFTADLHYGCNGDTVFFTNTSMPAADLFHRWNFGDIITSTEVSPMHIYRGQGAFKAKLTTSNGYCLTSDSIIINIDNFVDAGYTKAPDQFVCQGVPVTFTDTSRGTIPLAYSWFYGDGGLSTAPAGNYTFNTIGNYEVMQIVTNPHGCSDTAISNITVDPITPFELLATDSFMCRGQQVTFTGRFTNQGNTGITWAFGDGSGNYNVNPVTHAYDGVGTFTVTGTATFRACPTITSSREVTFYSQPDIYLGPDFTFCPGSQPIQLRDSRNSSNPRARWMWNTDEAGSSITVKKPGTYIAVVTVDGCTASDTVNVAKDCYINIPNIFSPDGDGLNDYFYPRQTLTSGLTSFSLVIYNRWGQMVYETNTIDGQGWDGKMNGIPQPNGVYVYSVDATFKDGQIEHHKGNVTLMR